MQKIFLLYDKFQSTQVSENIVEATGIVIKADLRKRFDTYEFV